jgi:organic radical activating enzyme
MLNNQAPEGRNTSPDTFEVHSIFYTIQGEGPFAGQPAIFIRMAGCNLQCPGCDTDYTSFRNIMTIPEIVNWVKNLNASTNLIVITGGEPLRQNLFPLVDDLLYRGFFVQIETNGTLPFIIPEHRDVEYLDHYNLNRLFIVCSPKTSHIHSSIRRLCHHYKYVLSADSLFEADGLPKHVLNHMDGTHHSVFKCGNSLSKIIYVQPADTGNVELNYHNQQACVKSALKFGYNLQLQIHKIIGVE